MSLVCWHHPLSFPSKSFYYSLKCYFWPLVTPHHISVLILPSSNQFWKQKYFSILWVVLSCCIVAGQTHITFMIIITLNITLKYIFFFCKCMGRHTAGRVAISHPCPVSVEFQSTSVSSHLPKTCRYCRWNGLIVPGCECVCMVFYLGCIPASCQLFLGYAVYQL